MKYYYFTVTFSNGEFTGFRRKSVDYLSAYLDTIRIFVREEGDKVEPDLIAQLNDKDNDVTGD